ncbi:hypothetical protein Barb7_03063 [Bacteroidales bacterium Barb7]|nr:hypothetical protein Barb7_03063 [Bacteroidales bacterium Barb7]
MPEKVATVREEQPIKAESPINDKLEGRAMPVKEVQSAKAEFPIDVKRSPEKVTAVREEQRIKADS